jgi:ankyrin repeat protein
MVCLHGSPKLVSLLSRKGADTKEVGEDGRNAYHWSCERGHARIFDSIRSILRLRDVGMTTPDYNGVRPLHLACATENPRLVHSLITNMKMTRMGFGPIHLNDVDNDNLRPIHYACRSGNQNVFKILRKLRPDLGRDVDGLTLLDHASKSGNWPIVNYIVSEKNLLNIVSPNWKTETLPKALCLAFKDENIEVVKQLLRAANLNNASGEENKSVLISIINDAQINRYGDVQEDGPYGEFNKMKTFFLLAKILKVDLTPDILGQSATAHPTFTEEKKAEVRNQFIAFPSQRIAVALLSPAQKGSAPILPRELNNLVLEATAKKPSHSPIFEAYEESEKLFTKFNESVIPETSPQNIAHRMIAKIRTITGNSL